MFAQAVDCNTYFNNANSHTLRNRIHNLPLIPKTTQLNERHIKELYKNAYQLLCKPRYLLTTFCKNNFDDVDVISTPSRTINISHYVCPSNRVIVFV